MANRIEVEVAQVGPATSEARIRSHRTLIDRSEAKGGEDRGPMGGELLLASLGGCFLSNLLAAIRSRAAAIQNVQVNVMGNLDGSPARFRSIDMTVSADSEDGALLEKLVAISERSCIVANTLRDSVTLTVTVQEASLRRST